MQRFADLPGSLQTPWKIAACWLLAPLLLMTSCTSIRPIVKIGLIAPFEGLYRESGYAALDAMRQAIDACAPAGLDVLPVALDDGGDPAQAARAAQKLAVDPMVRAVIGPLLLDNVPAVAHVITPTAIGWFVPPLVTPDGDFNGQNGGAGLAAQIEFVAAQSAAARVLLLGLPAEWPTPLDTDIPIVHVESLATLRAMLNPDDALLWLGRPDAGARWLTTLQAEGIDVNFWLAEQGGLDVFALHSAADMGDRQPNRKGSYWLLWRDSEYNGWSPSGASTLQPSEATRYSTYRATCAALAGQSPAQQTWQLQSHPVGD